MELRMVCLMLLGCFASACGDSGDDDSPERVNSAIEAYCQNATKCGVYRVVETCTRERTQRFSAFHSNESKACRSAELGEYECYAELACDDFETGCDAAEEKRDDACGP